jgi:hypothetical protein
MAGETEVLGENLPQRHFVHHKSHMTRHPVLNSGRRGGKPATNFFLFVRWDFGYCGHYWPIVPAPDDRQW